MAKTSIYHQQREATVREAIRSGARGSIRWGQVPRGWQPLLRSHLIDVARCEMETAYADAGQSSGVGRILELLRERMYRLRSDEDPTTVVRRFIRVVRQGDMFDAYRRSGTVNAERRRDGQIAQGKHSGGRKASPGFAVRKRRSKPDPFGSESLERRAEVDRRLSSDNRGGLPRWIDDQWLERRAPERGVSYEFSIDERGRSLIYLEDAHGRFAGCFVEDGIGYRRTSADEAALDG